MKIEAITLREVQMPLVHFFETSFGRVYSRRILLISVDSDGIRGWSECVAAEDPFYSSEWIDSAWPTITHHLAKPLLGKTLSQGREAVALLTQFAGIAWPRQHSKMRCGTWRHARKNSHCGSCWGNAPRDCLRSVDRHSGFSRTTARED